VVGSHLAIVFRTPADLAKMTMSASKVGVHLHIECDGITLMPMYEDLIRLGQNCYIFLFDLPAKVGRHIIRVYWSDAQHQPMESTVQKVSVTVATGGNP
jgi:hypothetical protein